MNGGFGGDNVAAMLVRWNAHFATQGYSTLIFLGGVNDLRAGATAAATYATAVQILAAARARGMTVVVVSVTPWGNWFEWTAGKQTETLAYNALLSAWATTNGQTYVDAYTALSAGGGTPEDLAAIYDSGDGLHPNAAGSVLLANTVGGGIP
jgi:lysophospholipase L1-like esterase